MLGLCLYGLLSRKKHFIRFGLSGLGGSIFGWGVTHMILGDPITGFFAVLFGLALIWFANPGMLKLLRRRKGSWIQINNQNFWLPRGSYLEFTMNPPSPATKIEKSVLPKKGEKEKDYKKRMQ
ncbi:hypothetical protein LCGC14_0726720 [marine sediment metagenome]|uniref:Uncharacterized protein n=1 Tax=marine sediment metagenome TaxID=412755 RepID=A0A0F9SW23_9ZZZZ